MRTGPAIENAFWITYVGIPSLVVTLAMLIGFRGFARVLLEDRGITGFPEWFNALGRDPFLGPLPLSLVVFALSLAVLSYVLHWTSFGGQVFVIGNNAEMSRYSGVRVARIRAILFVLSGVIAAMAGLFCCASPQFAATPPSALNSTSSPWCFWAASASSAARARCLACCSRSSLFSI
jgi:ribose/xylose/arabinose/galactoside ABC-type transport system permease subunit